MAADIFEFEIVGVDRAESNNLAGSLTDRLIEIDGIQRAERSKSEIDSMDIGSIVSVVVSSGAALALAKGVADWLRARSGTSVVFRSRDKKVAATIKGVDAPTAERMLDALLKSTAE